MLLSAASVIAEPGEIARGLKLVSLWSKLRHRCVGALTLAISFARSTGRPDARARENQSASHSMTVLQFENLISGRLCQNPSAKA